MADMTDLSLRLRLVAVILGVGLAVPAPAAGAESDGRTLMRYPTLHANTIVFVAHDNLWSVPRAGGVASRLTADPGRDVMPRFSPDGRWIAFTGEYQGSRDVYLIPAAVAACGASPSCPTSRPSRRCGARRTTW